MLHAVRFIWKLFGNVPVLAAVQNLILLFINGLLVVVFSLFMTLLIRCLLLPSSVNLEIPLNFVFRSCDFSTTGVGPTGANNPVVHNNFGVVCSYLEANISFRNEANDEFLMEKGVPYNFDLQIMFPDSEANREAGGMFLIVVTLLDEDLSPVATFRRSAIIPYTSYLIRIIRKLMFLPLYIADFWRETVTLNLDVSKSFRLNHYDKNVCITKIEFQHVFLQINRAKLKLAANLTGVRYFLHYWPLVTSTIIFGTSVLFLATFSFVYWLFKSFFAFLSMIRVENDADVAETTSLIRRRYDSGSRRSNTDELLRSSVASSSRNKYYPELFGPNGGPQLNVAWPEDPSNSRAYSRRQR